METICGKISALKETTEKDKRKPNFVEYFDILASGNPDAYKKFKNSSRAPDPVTVKQKIKDTWKWFVRNNMRGSVKTDSYEYADFRFQVRKNRTATIFNAEKADMIVQSFYKDISTEDYDEMSRRIFVLDAVRDIEKGLYGTNPIFVNFGFTEPEIMNLYNASTKMQREEIDILIATRQELFKKHIEKLIEKGSEAGLDYRYLLSDDVYMHHFVTKYAEDTEHLILKRNKSGTGTEPLKGREGTFDSYSTYLPVTDYLVMFGIYNEMSRIDLLLETRKISDSYMVLRDVVVDDDFRLDFGEKLRIFSGSQMSLSKYQSPIHILDEPILRYFRNMDTWHKSDEYLNFEQIMKAKGISPDDPRFMVADENYAHIHFSGGLILPEDIADVLDAEFSIRKSLLLPTVLRKINSGFRWATLRSPFAFLNYQKNNTYGDMTALILTSPRVYLNVKAGKLALEGLYKWYYKGELIPEIEFFYEEHKLIATRQNYELEDLRKKLPSIKSMYEKGFKEIDNDPKKAVALIKKVDKALDIGTLADFRENFLRLWAALHFKEELSKTHDGLPKNHWFGGSVPEDIIKLSTIERRAVKLSDDALGAYDDLSPTTNLIAKHAIPFYHYVAWVQRMASRIAMNSFVEPFRLDDMGVDMSKNSTLFRKAGTMAMTNALKVAGLITAIGSLTMMLNELTKSITGKDRDKDLPERITGREHINLPFGKDRTYSLLVQSIVGEFRDFWNLDDRAVRDIMDLVTGKQTDVKKIIANAMSGPLDYFTYSAYGPIQTLQSFYTGIRMYPDPKNPQKGEPLQIAAEFFRLGDEYKKVMGLPMYKGEYAKDRLIKLIASVTYHDKSSYDRMYELEDIFREDVGLPEKSSVRLTVNDQHERIMSSYTHNYLQSIKLQDKDSAVKYLTGLIGNNVDRKLLQTKVKNLKPMSGLSKKDKAEFNRWINKAENSEYKRVYDEANRYYDWLISDHKRLMEEVAGK